MIQAADMGRSWQRPPNGRERSARTWLSALGLVGLVLLPSAAHAQPGRLMGLVRDSSGSPVSNASVSASEARVATRTDDRGFFRLANLPPGPLGITIRRLGFDPVHLLVEISEAPRDTIHIVLEDVAEALAPVNVNASAARQRKSIEAFYERSLRGVGTYITRADILAHGASRTIDLFRGVGGVRIVRGSGGDGIRFNTSSQMRVNCAPMMWMDGQRAPGMEIGDVSLNDIEGIELYNGPSTTPMQFSQGPSGGSCGVVIVWTRPPPAARPR